MSKVSVLIPCRGEGYNLNGETVLARTVRDIYEKARGEIEAFVVFDGEPYQELPAYPNLNVLYRDWRGTKTCLNEAAQLAQGKYLLKTDAHCMFSEGFDLALQEPMEPNWVVTPRFYVLDAEHWKWQDDRYYDYFLLPCPFTNPRGFYFKAGGHWPERNEPRKGYTIDENMKLHGSAWFMEKRFYWDCLGGLDPKNGAGPWNGEDIEISLKTWLGPWGGKLIVNKSCWYAHMHRGSQRPREYGFSHNEAYRSARWTARYWMSDQWEGRAHDIEWLVDKFSPVPGWPTDWKDLHKEWLYYG